MRTDLIMYRKNKSKDIKNISVSVLALIFSSASFATDYAGIAVDPFIGLVKTPLSGPNAKIAPENNEGTGPEDSTVYYKDVMAQTAVSFDITAESTGLIGEQIDQSSGAISFTQTDIEIPGNSILPVNVRRVFNDTNFKQKATAEFSDWSLELPSIHTTVLMPGTVNAGAWGQGLECSGNQRPGAVNYKGSVVDANQYWNGVSMLVDGSQQHLLYHGGTSSKYFTKNHWKLNCFKRADNSGEGFIATSPAGVKYTFDVPHAVRSYASSEDQRSLPIYHLYLRVSKIEDLHGNWVQYNYTSYVNSNNKTSQRLDSISSNDGRNITFAYESLPERRNLIKSFTANGQTWEYRYSNDLLPSLEKVILPSDAQNPMAWEFDLKQLSLWHNPALLPDYQEMQYQCVKKPIYVTGTIKHPKGALGRFELEPVVHGRTKVPSQIDNGSLDKNSTCFITLGLKRKTLTGPGLSTMLWNYSYSENLGAYLGENSASDAPVSIDGYDKKDLKTTTVTSPDGSKTISVFYRAWTYLDGQQVATIYLDTNGATELKRQWSSYVSRPEQIGDPFVNADFSTNNFSLAYPARLSSTTISLSGDTINSQFKTVYEAYNNYDVSERWIETNKLNAIERTTTLTLQNDTDKWVLNQETNRQITQEGKSYSEHATTYYGTNETGKYLPKTESKFGQHIRTHEYYADGTLKKTTYALGDRWVAFADYKRGKPRKITLPNRYSAGSFDVMLSVNDTGTVAWAQDLNGNKTSYSYDNLNRLTLIDPEDSQWLNTSITYDADYSGTGALQQNISRGNYRKTITLDALMQPVLSKEWDSNNETDTVRYVQQSFNAYGKIVFTSVPSTSSTESFGSGTGYDGLQRITSQSNTANGDISYSYGSNNSVTVSGGVTSTTQYLAYGSPAIDLPLTITQPEGVTTSIRYNEANLPLTITQGGITEERRYNSAMQLCLQKRPDTGIKVVQNNALGQVTGYAEGLSDNPTDLTNSCADYVNAPNSWVRQTYDSLGDAWETSYLDGTATKTVTLDRQGNLTGLVNGSNSWSYAYNSLSLPYQQSLTLDSKTYTIGLIYNNHGHLQSKTYGGATLAYAPNALGLPTHVADSQTYASNVLYYPNGQLKSYRYGNGLTFNQTLDTKFKPYERQIKSGTTLRAGQRYRYDSNDNLDNITDQVNPAQSISLTFDGLNRLDTASGVWGSGNFDYDTLSNLTVKQLGTQNLSYVYHPSTKRLSTVTGGYSFIYDDRGNVIGNGKRAFQFNRANQLVSSGTISYQYDGHGRRVKKTGSSSGYSIYDLSGTLLLSDGPNGQTRYIHLGKELIAKVGSAAALEDKPGYTGHAEDKDLSLTYMQQRYYDPVIGRFYTNDPVGFSASNPMMFNRYAYANNNPYKYVDSDGRDPDRLSGMVAGAMLSPEDGASLGRMTAAAGDSAYSAGVDAGSQMQQATSDIAGGAPVSKAATNAVARMNAVPVKASKMQQKVEKGQAPKSIARFDKADANQPNSKDHVHKSDGTSMNNDGTVHDKKNGSPEFTNKEKEFLKQNGWPTEVKKE